MSGQIVELTHAEVGDIAILDDGRHVKILTLRILHDKVIAYLVGHGLVILHLDGKNRFPDMQTHGVERVNVTGVIKAAKGNGDFSEHRDRLGRRVREIWVEWAKRQPNPKPSWLASYDELSEADKEADRCIGSALWDDFIAQHIEEIASAAFSGIAS